MNVHQLELFYHVVVNQSVSRAAKALGREQPTLSRQINELEAGLRVELFHRRPFQLTEKGALLFKGIEPFFRELPRLEQQVMGGDLIRIGAPALALAEHLPAVEKLARRQFPHLRAVLREANQPQLLEWMERGEIDLAVTLIPAKLPQKIFSKGLIELPMVLLAPGSGRAPTAEQLWSKAGLRGDLICLTADEMLCEQFQAGLRRLGIEWQPTIEVGSLDLVQRYTLEGYGFGLTVRLPGMRLPKTLRIIELPGFPALPFGLLWRDNEDKLVRVFRELIEQRAVAKGKV